ncbi:hypothetical protein Mucpa_0876 [Mucilaginibacter paludis DSM 18603]|uniref:Uncharacterized protein n=1 Tax=Mucilaginibacter paludis DSM 18603 TaxID=714943 RepID=H1YBI6_9SPHI|nr:hypothetical protein Mucpa_0876 [Mucilaginibacter paludis DSM 18603]
MFRVYHIAYKGIGYSKGRKCLIDNQYGINTFTHVQFFSVYFQHKEQAALVNFLVCLFNITKKHATIITFLPYRIA